MSDLFPGHGVGHAGLVHRAVRWLRVFHKCGVVFGEMTAAVPYYPDALGWRLNFSILVECKASRSDFFADRKKGIHGEGADSFPGEERWYLTPPGLVKPEEVPTGWYLAEAHGRAVKVVTHPPTLPPLDTTGWPPEWIARHPPPEPARTPSMWIRPRHHERAAAGLPYLLSAVRRHEIGVRWLDSEARFESINRQAAREADERCGRVRPALDPQRCHGGSDGDCYWSGCPQLRDGEPEGTGRHCPLDRQEDDSV